ncbi:hypothetical protein A2U01_0114085, partial [Trifolium medium]|nr:hypothetical protein [Trifolium medium]
MAEALMLSFSLASATRHPFMSDAQLAEQLPNLSQHNGATSL